MDIRDEGNEEDRLRQWFEESEGVKLPLRREVCPTCRGNGTHVNPNIDRNGISPYDEDLDEDFWDSYRSGYYDVICYRCEGRNVVDEVDYDSMSRELRASWDRYLRDYYEDRAMQAAEMRMGA